MINWVYSGDKLGLSTDELGLSEINSDFFR